MPESTVKNVDILIVTALQEEAKSIVVRLENCDISYFPEKDIRTYRIGYLSYGTSGHTYRIAVVFPSRIGQTSAATAVVDAIRSLNPNIVLLVGIAGGIQNKGVDLGDVVVADQIVGYEYDKIKNDVIEYRDRVYPASDLLLDRAKNFWDDSWKQQINISRQKNTSKEVSTLSFGPIASGNKVISSSNFQKSLTSRWPSLLAVEMEAEGVYTAVFDRPSIRHVLVIRGISDMADERKSDDWKEYAANAAAAFTIAFLKSGPIQIERSSNQHFTPKISTAKLPSTHSDLFGRDKELATLDAAWKNPHINVLSLVAWAGVGKTALVNKWLSQIEQRKFCGAERIFGWSFYSQGAGEGRQVSSDQFINAALSWFGDPDPNRGSPWDKGERLADLVKKERTLLILDGLEPLQNPPPIETGRIKDLGLYSFLRELARQNPGLVVITTRLAVDDLKEFIGSTAIDVNLENLSTESGVAYLAHLGVKGIPIEIEQAVHEYNGHALALTLFGRYLVDVYNGDIRKKDLIPKVLEEEEKGAQTKRILESYEKWFERKPEQNILYILGLFDGPAEKGAIEALRLNPPMNGLTDNLQGLSHEKWQLALKHLRNARLLAANTPNEAEALDCHPLLREHFGGKLKMNSLNIWREAHSRLFEHYNSIAKEFPETIDEMTPLFIAIMHGCQAGRAHEALEIYYRRIQRNADINYCCSQLGAIGADLATLSSFFNIPWDQPLDVFSEHDRAVILNWVGYRLQALGRLTEASQAMQAALDSHIKQKNWLEATKDAINLSEISRTSGELLQAVDHARNALDLSDLSGHRYLQRVSRAILANCLHYTNQITMAERYFNEAETMQHIDYPKSPYLVSGEGIHYCELLIDQGKLNIVQKRAFEALKWAESTKNRLDISMAYLILGNVHLIQGRVEGINDFSQATTYLEEAVKGLKLAGRLDYVPLALLLRAELWRVTGALDKALLDLDEVCFISRRSKMELYEADCHLEYTRLKLLCSEQEKARKHWMKAKSIVEETGYHRRDKELKALEAWL